MNDNDRQILDALADRPVTAGLVRAVIRERDEARAAVQRVEAIPRRDAARATNDAVYYRREGFNDALDAVVAALGGSPEEAADSRSGVTGK